MVCFMVFNVTFNNISVISWLSVLLMEETGVPGENHRPVTSHWQTFLSLGCLSLFHLRFLVTSFVSSNSFLIINNLTDKWWAKTWRKESITLYYFSHMITLLLENMAPLLVITYIIKTHNMYLYLQVSGWSKGEGCWISNYKHITLLVKKCVECNTYTPKCQKEKKPTYLNYKLRYMS